MRPWNVEKGEEQVDKEQKEEVSRENMEQTAGEQETVVELDAGVGVQEKLAAAQEEIAGFQDKMLRAAAEFDNYKKRMERDRNTAMKYAGEHILRDILPVVDNLERALNQGVSPAVSAEQNLAALLEGVQLTLKSLLTTLEKFEVKPVESVGQPFNPNIQEALTMEANDAVPAGHVSAEFEKAYHYKDRLLRVAKVIVSSGAAA